MISYSIYIIDDEEAVRDGLTMALEADYQVGAFSTAESAIEAIEKSPPDLVLLDIGLPGMNGIEALSKIKTLHPDLLVYCPSNTFTKSFNFGQD
jgi:DNA-binding NarL/FixJ family response regulator